MGFFRGRGGVWFERPLSLFMRFGGGGYDGAKVSETEREGGVVWQCMLARECVVGGKERRCFGANANDNFVMGGRWRQGESCARGCVRVCVKRV